MKCRILKSGNCEITQGYNENHHANDIVGGNYTLDYIVAHTSGKVVFCQDGYNNMKGSTGNASYGNCVKIEHKNGYQTLYAHMQKGLSVSNGQYVEKGQVLGYMSDSGNAYGGHLHFEVWKDEVRINPTEYLDKDLYVSIKSPVPVEKNEKVDQVEVNCGDTTLRCRTGHSTNDDIIGFVKEGCYNIVSTYTGSDYTWYEIEKGKWVAGVEGCLIYHPLKEEPKKEEPKEEPKEEEIEITENFIKKFFKAIIDLIKKWLNA